MAKEFKLSELESLDDDEFDRDLFVTGEISNSTMEDIISDIVKINKADNKEDNKLKKFKREPITIYINSPGGDLHALFGLIDIIKESKTPIITKVVGLAASAAGILFLVGHKKFMGEFSTLHYHNVFTIALGDQYDMKNEHKELVRVQKLIDKIYLENSTLTQEQLDVWKETKKEKYISYREAKRWKMITDE